MKNMINWLKEEESGQGMVEYALILALLALVAVVGLGAVGKSVNEFFQKAESQVPDVG